MRTLQVVEEDVDHIGVFGEEEEEARVNIFYFCIYKHEENQGLDSQNFPNESSFFAGGGGGP